jgi:formamidopyrimidine-DNA glycosylase
MLEIPEAVTIAGQLESTLAGKRITRVIAAGSPHKFAWYHKDPGEYHDLLAGRAVTRAEAPGGKVLVKLGPTVTMLFGEGVALRYHAPLGKRPLKHQLLLEFEDSSALSGSVQMYGGLWCFKEGEFENYYYDVAREKPSPLSAAFSEQYFSELLSSSSSSGLSAKAFLATEQRIPGFGNGVLHDVLFNASIHPRRKMNTLADEELKGLFMSIKRTLAEMTEQGGRDTEKDLYGQPGGYKTILSQNTVHEPCPRCGGVIQKANYMGGAVYYCSECQPLKP